MRKRRETYEEDDKEGWTVRGGVDGNGKGKGKETKDEQQADDTEHDYDITRQPYNAKVKNSGVNPPLPHAPLWHSA
jgi:hypothetical protein